MESMLEWGICMCIIIVVLTCVCIQFFTRTWHKKQSRHILQHCGFPVTEEHVKQVYPIRVQIMQRVDRLMKDISCQYIVDQGNLLAITRGEYIAHDDDLDIRTFEHHKLKKYVADLPHGDLGIWKKFNPHRCKTLPCIRPWQKEKKFEVRKDAKHGLLLAKHPHLPSEDGYIALLDFEHDELQYLQPVASQAGITGCVYGYQVDIVPSSCASEIWGQIDHAFQNGLQYTKYFDTWVPIPHLQDTHAHLTKLYGKDWHICDKPSQFDQPIL